MPAVRFLRIVLMVTLITACTTPGGGTAVRPTGVPSVTAPAESAPSDVRTVQRTIRELAADDDRITAYGRAGGGVVSVELRPDAAALAEEFHRRFGDDVDIAVGGPPYPPSRVTDEFACPEVRSAPWPKGVETSLELADDAIAQGATTSGVVTVTNGSDTSVTIASSRPLAWVFDDASATQPVGHPGVITEPTGDATSAGASEQDGPERTIAPGATARISATIGTASCDPANSYVLAPGDYVVRVQPDLERPQRLTPPASLRITAR